MNKVPESNWFCELCQEFQEKGRFVGCFFCSCQGGILRKTIIGTKTGKVKNINPEYHSKMTKIDEIVDQEIKLCVKEEEQEESFKFILSRSINQHIKKASNVNDLSRVKNKAKCEKLNDNTSGLNMVSSQNVFQENLVDFSDEKDEIKNSINNSRNEVPFKNKNTNEKTREVLTPDFIYFDYNKEIKRQMSSKNIELYKNFIPKTQNCWVHNSCLLQNHETTYEFFSNPIKFINFNLWKNTITSCYICKNEGGSIKKCSDDDCRRYFHGECARRRNYDISVNIKEECFITISCPFHQIKSTKKMLTNIRAERQKTLDDFFKNFKIINEKRKKEKRELEKQARLIFLQKGNNYEKVEVEWLFKFLTSYQIDFLKEFKRRAVKSPKYSFRIDLVRIKYNPKMFRITNIFIPSTGVFSVVPTKNMINWLFKVENEKRTAVQNFQFYIELQSLLNRVQNNFDFYFSRSSSGNHELRNQFDKNPSSILTDNQNNVVSEGGTIDRKQSLLAFDKNHSIEISDEEEKSLQNHVLDDKKHENRFFKVQPLDIEKAISTNPQIFLGYLERFLHKCEFGFKQEEDCSEEKHLFVSPSSKISRDFDKLLLVPAISRYDTNDHDVFLNEDETVRQDVTIFEDGMDRNSIEED